MITIKQATDYMHTVKKLFLFLVAVSFSCALRAQNGATGKEFNKIKNNNLEVARHVAGLKK
jgi:hypothetical protein